MKMLTNDHQPPVSKSDDIKPSEDWQDTPPPLTTSSPITLQVGERRFTTLCSTLTAESPYFTRLFSPQWRRTQSDGSYFIDADGDLFPHILRYLRSGVLPIFYNSSNGHDYSMYLALLGEARYFQITRLENWLRNKEYEKAVKIEYSAQQFEGPLEKMLQTSSDLHVTYHPAWKTEKVYLCPRRIPVHRGLPSACGKACRNAQGDGDDEFEDEIVLRTLVISKRTILDHGICLQE